MQLEKYFTETDGGFSFSRQQASDFAKTVAGDFNPIHDVDAKRFCVPGDLLFATVVARQGLWRRMHFRFSGMVGDGVTLSLEPVATNEVVLGDGHGKHFLSVCREGEVTHDAQIIDEVVCQYVSFSGQTFPDILVPLMASHEVMINPDRPLVIYESMEIDLDTLDIAKPRLALVGTSLAVKGRRGDVEVRFDLHDHDRVVGRGSKKLALGGLQAWDADKIESLVATYRQRKAQYGQA